MIRQIRVAALALAAAGCASLDGGGEAVSLTVAGPPISAAETGQPFVYERPVLPEGMSPGGGANGILAQGWSMLGREDRAAATGDGEYAPRTCAASPGGVSGLPAIADAIAARAADHRIVIVNESHSRTGTRELTRLLLPRLRAHGFTVLAAEAFTNASERLEPDPALLADGWPHQSLGWYSREPAFGHIVRDALGESYRLATYEHVDDPPGSEDDDVATSIARREEGQARNLMQVLAGMRPEERLLVHVGYSHAREATVVRADGSQERWMAARLKEYTGLDPLTVTQTHCHSADGQPRLAQAPAEIEGWFDLVVDIPVERFRNGRALWRLARGDGLVPIPRALQPVSEPLVIEAFAEGEPFAAVPVDRVYVEPGEDVALSLPPGRYSVRAVRLAED